MDGSSSSIHPGLGENPLHPGVKGVGGNILYKKLSGNIFVDWVEADFYSVIFCGWPQI